MSAMRVRRAAVDLADRAGNDVSDLPNPFGGLNSSYYQDTSSYSLSLVGAFAMSRCRLTRKRWCVLPSPLSLPFSLPLSSLTSPGGEDGMNIPLVPLLHRNVDAIIAADASADTDVRHLFVSRPLTRQTYYPNGKQ